LTGRAVGVKRALEERVKTYREAAEALESTKRTLEAAGSSTTYMDKSSHVNKKVVAAKTALNLVRLVAPSPLAQLIISISGTALTPLAMSNILPRPRSVSEAIHEAAAEIRKLLDLLYTAP